MTRALVIIGALGSWWCSGCEGWSAAEPIGGQIEDPVTMRNAPAERPTDPGSDSDPLERGLLRLGEQFAPEMETDGPMLRGSLSIGEKHDYQMVMQAGVCYRILGRGGPGVTDLDLFLFESSGLQVRQDLARDSSPVLGMAHPICPERSSAYRLQVRMVEGSGEFGVRLFRSGP